MLLFSGPARSARGSSNPRAVVRALAIAVFGVLVLLAVLVGSAPALAQGVDAGTPRANGDAGGPRPNGDAGKPRMGADGFDDETPYDADGGATAPPVSAAGPTINIPQSEAEKA